MNWLDILVKVFDAAIVPILGAVAVYVVTLINAKKQELMERAKNDTTKKYIEMLDETIVSCVLATNQTYVNALKESGAFDLDAQKYAFKLTYDAVLAILTEDAKKYLNEAINDLSAYITNKIEAQIAAEEII